MISLIVAHDFNQAIGYQNSLPWKLPQDLKIFKQITSNNYIVMGRKTFDSIGRPLPNRKNIILTNDDEFTCDNCIIFNDINQVIRLDKEKQHHEIFIIGGSEIYQQFIHYADRLYISTVHANIDPVDTYFPKWDKSLYKTLGNKLYAKDKDNDYEFEFEVWEKITL